MGFRFCCESNFEKLLGEQVTYVACTVSYVQFAIVSVEYDSNNIAISIQNNVCVRNVVGGTSVNELVSLGYGVLRAFHTLGLIVVNCDEYAIVIQISSLRSNTSTSCSISG